MSPQIVQQLNIVRAHIDLLSLATDEMVAAMRRSALHDPAQAEMAEHHLQLGFDCMRRVFPSQ